MFSSIKILTDSDSRKRLRSASTPALVVPPTRRMTIGDRAFPVAGARVWNALPSFVTDSATVATFKRHLLLRRNSSGSDYVQCTRSFLG